MTTQGALNAAAAGMKAQATKLGMLSNNIANQSTNGYKGTESNMKTQVTQTGSNVAYSPGGVRNMSRATVTQQGLIQASSSTTHVAISGGGFFVVSDSTTSSNVFFTRDGSFQPDNLGNLKLGDFTLKGWLLDANGQIPAANADISSLTDVNVSTLSGVASTTTKVDLGINLNAAEVLGATSISLGTTPVDAVELQTALGNPGVTTDLNIALNGGAPTNISILTTDTLAAVIVKINAIVGVTATEVNGKLIVNVDSMNDTLTLTNGAVGDVVSTLFGQAQVVKNGRDFRRTLTIFDSLGTPRDIEVDFKKNNTNQWNVEARIADASIATTTNGLIGTAVLDFNTSGNLSSIAGALAGPVAIPWDLAQTGAGNQTVTFDFGIDVAGAKTQGNVTQLTSGYNVNFVNQNGAGLGLKTGIAIDNQGYVVASFSNGEFRKLYKLPLATFANPDGLDAKTGNVFAQSSASGEYNLREAGDSGAGKIAEGSLEFSNVDIGNELTKLIETQTAYSAATKVISTADQMLRELTSLR
jgi:flagellar hook protein FlgE